MDSDTNAKIDMSLDDIIRMEGIRGPRRFGGGGRMNNRTRNNRSYDYRNNQRFNRNGFRSFRGNNRNIPKRPYSFQNRPRQVSYRNRSYRSATLHISNLAMNVTSDDLNELFSSFGNLNHAFVHYDQYGASLCTAEVEFERRDEANEARNKLDGVPLDGKPLRITMINTSNDDAFTSFLKSTTSSNRRTQSSSYDHRHRSRNNYTNERGRRFNSNNQNNRKKQNLSADDLDRELDEWRMKSEENQNASQINGQDDDGMIEDLIE